MKNAKIREQKIGQTRVLRTLVFELQMIERILQADRLRAYRTL